MNVPMTLISMCELENVFQEMKNRHNDGLLVQIVLICKRGKKEMLVGFGQ